MRLAIQARGFVAALAILAAALMTAKPAGGEEPCPRRELRIEVKASGVPMLDKIPYVGRLFKNSAVKPACDETVERIGVDFDFLPGQVIRFHGPLDVCPEVCPVCPVAASKDAVKCAGESCEACPAKVVATAAKCCEKSACGCAGGKCCAAKDIVSKGELSELWEHIAELTAENAAMEATLESQEAILEATLEGHGAVLEAKGEMFESVAELMVEKAKLEAKLEMVEHRDAMLKEMVELHAENARLKAQAELAVQKEELLKAQLTTVLENERLKQRVAELERSHHGEESPVLAEKKQLKAKKTR
ncbi:MAG TPA: hypothetical protein VMP01_16655 [Pirellulaceae bacterium]|nr:hypothetical protein [Pirellulaceae bacterium]